MRDTFVGSAHGRADLAVGCDGANAMASFELDTVSMGAGDVWSTTADLAGWDNAIRGDGLLSAASRSAMVGPQFAFGAEAPDKLV